MKRVISPLHHSCGITSRKNMWDMCLLYLTFITFKKSWKKYHITIIIVIIHSFTHSLFAQSECM